MVSAKVFVNVPCILELPATQVRLVSGTLGHLGLTGVYEVRQGKQLVLKDDSPVP